jgi:hypothetical protein
MKYEREFDTSPIVKGVNYSLFILWKDIMSMESKEQPGAAPVASPLLSSQSANPFGVFRVSPPPHREIA